MTPRPLYRWKSLWLGMFVLIFLAWAWRDSTRHSSAVVFGYEGAVWHAGGNVGIIKLKPSRVPVKQEIGFSRNSFDGYVHGRYLLPRTQVVIPHWLFIVLFLVPWLGFLVWRVRRERMLK